MYHGAKRVLNMTWSWKYVCVFASTLSNAVCNYDWSEVLKQTQLRVLESVRVS